MVFFGPGFFTRLWPKKGQEPQNKGEKDRNKERKREAEEQEEEEEEEKKKGGTKKLKTKRNMQKNK